MIAEIEQKDSKAAFVGVGSALEQLEARTVQTVNKDNDGFRRIARTPPALKRNTVIGSKLDIRNRQSECGRIRGPTLSIVEPAAAVCDEKGSANGEYNK